MTEALISELSTRMAEILGDRGLETAAADLLIRKFGGKLRAGQPK